MILHVKYNKTECLCGYLHWAGRFDEAKKAADAKRLRQELTELGVPVDVPTSEALVKFSKQSGSSNFDTTDKLNLVTCDKCLVKIDMMVGTPLLTIEGVKIKVKPPPDEPEYRSIEDFATFLQDDERSTYTSEEMNIMRAYLEITTSEFQYRMSKFSKLLEPREKPKNIRGICSSNHDRWYGPGSERTHGGGSGF